MVRCPLQSNTFKLSISILKSNTLDFFLFVRENKQPASEPYGHLTVAAPSVCILHCWSQTPTICLVIPLSIFTLIHVFWCRLQKFDCLAPAHFMKPTKVGKKQQQQKKNPESIFFLFFLFRRETSPTFAAQGEISVQKNSHECVWQVKRWEFIVYCLPQGGCV